MRPIRHRRTTLRLCRCRLRSPRISVVAAGCVEIGRPHLYNGSSWLRLCVFILWRLFVEWRRRSGLLGPDSVDASAISRESAVIAEEDSTRFEGIVSPGIVVKSM